MVGSTPTLEHTSVKREAVMVLILLCKKFGEPSLLQERACSVVKGLPHTHSTGMSLGIQPCWRAKASQRAPLCRVKPCSRIRRELNHEEATFSCANSTAWLRSLGSSGRRTSAMDSRYINCFVLKYFLLRNPNI